MKRQFDWRLAGNMVAASGRHLTAAVSGIVTIAMIARRLGVDGLAAWALLGTASVLLGLSNLGLTTAIYRSGVAGSPERTRRAAGLSLLVVACAAPLFAVGIYPLVASLPGASPALAKDLARAAPLALLGGVVQAFASPFKAFLLISGNFGRLARIRFLTAISQVAVMAAWLSVDASLAGPAAGLLAGALVELLLTAQAARELDPEIPIRPRLESGRHGALASLREGAAQLTVNLAVAAALRLDVFVLARVSSLAVVAAYAVASRAVDQSFVLAKQASSALMPRFGERAARDHAVLLGSSVLGGLVASGMLALVLDGRTLLSTWAGPVANLPAATLALWLLSSAAILSSLIEVPASALTVGGRSAWEGAVPLAIGCGVNVAITFGAASRGGVWAVAGGTVVGNAVIALLVWHRVRRSFGWSGEQVARAIAPTVAAATTAVLAGLLLAPFSMRGVLASVFSCLITMVLGCGAAALVATRVLAMRQDALTGPSPSTAGPA